jgi:hypothetical protein
MIMYKYQIFKTKEEALAFQKKHGGVYHNLKWEKQHHQYDSITFYECSEELRNEYPFSVEWNQTI